MLWLFFVIFGCVLFIPSTLLLLLFNRFKNTIVLLIKENGALIKIIINNKDLEKGEVTKVKGKSIIPIKITKEEIYYGKWRRWIIKSELESKNISLTNKEVEDYLNNEDLLKLYLAGKFKDTLMIIIVATILCVIIGAIINGYLTTSKQCIISQDNSTKEFIINSVRIAFQNITMG
jgi:hypothetical protein